MKTKFETEVKEIGKLSEGLLNNKYFILFDENNMDFANEFGFTVKHQKPLDEIKVHDIVEIDNNKYQIIEISDKTNEHLKKETHVSFQIDRDFDGPRQILLKGNSFPIIKLGTKIKISG